jgi:hypothetical protein
VGRRLIARLQHRAYAVSKIAIVNMPFPPIGTDSRQREMLREAVTNTVGAARAADTEVIVAMFPDGSHHVVKDRDGDTEITVINR